MSRNITKIETLPKLEKLKKVAAYARVSNGKDAMLHSLSAQISYYNGLIQNHSGWEFCGVYADEAKSGTRDNRESFVSLINDCRAGRYDHYKVNFPVCKEYDYAFENGERIKSNGYRCVF